MCFRRSEGIWPAGNGFGMGFKSPLAHTENPQVRRPAGSSYFLGVRKNAQTGCTVAS